MSDRVDGDEAANDSNGLQDEVSKYGRKLMRQMAPLKFETANRAGDTAALEESVHNFNELGMNDTAEARIAKELLGSIKRLEADLTTACDLRDRNEIRKVLKEIRSDDQWFSDKTGGSVNSPRVTMYLRKEIESAQNLAESLAISAASPPVILAMDKKTMSELKSYVKPAPLVHRVMQAVFLLFNEDEDKTSNWAFCQKLLVPEGTDGLNRKLMKFNADNLHPFIVQRVQKLLKDIELRDVQKASPGAATFFVWAMNVVSSKTSQESNDATGTPPVSVDAGGKKLTREQIAKRERAELSRSIKLEREIFSQRRKPSDVAGDQSPRRLNYYAVLR